MRTSYSAVTNTYNGWDESKIKSFGRSGDNIYMYEDDAVRAAGAGGTPYGALEGSNVRLFVGVNGLHLESKLLFTGRYLTSTEIGNLYTAWNTYKNSL